MLHCTVCTINHLRCGSKIQMHQSSHWTSHQWVAPPAVSAKKHNYQKKAEFPVLAFFLRQHDKHTTNPNITVLLLFSLYSKFTRCTLHSTVYSTLFDCTVCIFSSDSARQVHTCCSSVFKAMFCLRSSIEKPEAKHCFSFYSIMTGLPTE